MTRNMKCNASPAHACGGMLGPSSSGAAGSGRRSQLRLRANKGRSLTLFLHPDLRSKRQSQQSPGGIAMHRSRQRSFLAGNRLNLSKLAAVALAAAMAEPVGAAVMKPSDWPAMPNSSTSSDFSAVQMATGHGRDFVREWNRPGPHGDVHGETHFRLGEPIDTFIAFRGCRADAAGRCNVTATFVITGPDGNAQASPPMDVWANQREPTPGMIFLSRASLGLNWGPTDPPGLYRIRAAVTDHVAGVTLKTRQVLTLSK
jgi:hypothetical protein